MILPAFHVLPLLFAFVLAAPVVATAAAVALAWEPSPDPRVVGYVVHWGPESGRYIHSSRDRGHDIGADETGYTVTGLPADAPTYFVVASVDAAGRSSEFSNEAARPEIRSPGPGFVARFGPCGCTTLSGAAAAESRVALFADGLSVGETRADGAGRWAASVDLTPAGDGPVTLVARATGAESFPVSGRAAPRTAAVPGDLDGDGGVGLSDAILALGLTVGRPGCGLSPACEVGGNGRIGLTDAVYLLQRAAGLRPVQ
jgi:hypothetical protein